jgi:hypothetical protein
MNMQEVLSELMRVGRLEGAERRRLRPPKQFWQTGKQHQGGVVSRDGTKFDLSYRFEDSLGKGDSHGKCGHGGRGGDFRNGKGAKDEAATTPATAKVLQQVDEKAANDDHGDADDGNQPCKPWQSRWRD